MQRQNLHAVYLHHGFDKLPKNTEMAISRVMGEGGGKKLGSTHQLLIFTFSRAYLSSILHSFNSSVPLRTLSLATGKNILQGKISGSQGKSRIIN